MTPPPPGRPPSQRGRGRLEGRPMQCAAVQLQGRAAAAAGDAAAGQAAQVQAHASAARV
jgi:hypothetical protein